MKKVLIVLCIIIASQRVFAYGEPQWSEFCPPQYQYVEYKKPTFWNTFFYNQAIAVKNNNYWANRKQRFINSIEICKNSTKEYVDECFQNLKISEMNQSNQFYLSEQQRIQQRQFQLQYLQNQQAINNQSWQNQQMINNQNRMINQMYMPQTYRVTPMGSGSYTINRY